MINLGVHPGGIREAGFQLSFAATAAILWTAAPRPEAAPREHRWFDPLRGLARVSLAADKLSARTVIELIVLTKGLTWEVSPDGVVVIRRPK